MRKDQLDGALSAGMLCQEVAPGFAVFRIPGLVQDRAEESYVQTRLFPTLREQARAQRHGASDDGLARHRRRAVARAHRFARDAAQAQLWQWELDQTSVAFTRAMGLHPMPMPVNDAGRAYEEGTTDGFIAIPSAIFGFQWFSRRVYMYQLPFAPLHGCALMTDGARTSACRPICARSSRRASVKFGLRIGETTRAQDEELLGGLFAKQGVRSVPVSPLLRGAVSRRCARGARQAGHAARAARIAAAGAIVPGRLPQRAPLI